jgi:hypothetical protein
MNLLAAFIPPPLRHIRSALSIPANRSRSVRSTRSVVLTIVRPAFVVLSFVHCILRRSGRTKDSSGTRIFSGQADQLKIRRT